MSHDGFADGVTTRRSSLSILVVVEGFFVLVDVVDDAAQAGAQDGEFVGDVELFGVLEQVGVFVFADHVLVEAMFDGVGVGEGCAGADGEGFAAVGVADAVPLTAWFLQGWPAAVVAVQVVIMGYMIHGRGW